MNPITVWMRNMVYLAVYALITPVILYRRIAKRRPLGVFRERFLGLTPRVPRDRHCVLLHAVSVGEVNLLESLLKKLTERYPDSRFLISTTTATGHQLAREKYPHTTSFYFPIDFSWAIRNLIRRSAPDVIVLTELEVWPNLVAVANQSGIPVAVINGRLSEKSFAGYQKARRWLQPTFRGLDLVVAQNEDYARRFCSLGCLPGRVHVAGSIKFDGAIAELNPTRRGKLADLIELEDEQVLWVAGSTQDPEESMAAGIWKDLRNQHPRLRLVIVPRHPERGSAIQRQLGQIGVDSCLQSALQPGVRVPGSQVLIADTIGQLREWWSLAQIAFVGGSFGQRGGQNMIEPAATGTAVCFGPNTWNFQQTVRLFLECEGAVQVQDEQQLRDFVVNCMVDPQFAKSIGQNAQQLVVTSVGAVDTTCDHLNRYFDSREIRSANSRAKAA